MSRLLQFTRTLVNTNNVSLSRNILTVRNTGNLIKTFSTKPQETFITIYKFPYIRQVAIGLIVKKYLMIGAVAAVGVGGVLEIGGVAPQNLTLSFALLGFFICVILVPFSYVLKNTIGFLSVTPNLKKIKISYADFWGKRIDKIINTNDWIPLSDLPVLRTDRFFLVPRLYSEKTTFRYFHANNFILDKDKMDKVFGLQNPSM